MGDAIQPPYALQILLPPGPNVLATRHVLESRTKGQPTVTQALPYIPPLFLAAAQIRDTVFVQEQKCSARDEIDKDDAISIHWVLFASPSDDAKDGRIPAATIRLVPSQAHAHSSDADADLATTVAHLTYPSEPDYNGSHVWDGEEQFVKIGRLATLPEFRGRGYGRVLVEELVKYVTEHPNEVQAAGSAQGDWKGLIGAHAQIGVKEWYQKLGFEVDEGMGNFWEEGIEHVGIWKKVGVKP